MTRTDKTTTGNRHLKGGLGGAPGPLIPESPKPELIDERTPGRDIKLAQAAVNKGWKIPDAAMEHLPREMLIIALDRQRDDRPRIAAAKVLTTMYQQANPAEKSGQTINVGVQVNQNDDLYD